jgi:hypothetical protein
MPISGLSNRKALRLLAGVALVAHSGCMSALTTASLRDVLLDTVDSLAEATALDATADTDVSTSVATDEAADEESLISEPPKPFSLDEAVERAVARLNGVGQLDPATQATLLSILENTNPQDWPAAIDAFTASLEAHRPPRLIAAPTPPPVAPPPVAPALVVAAVVAEPEPHEALVFPATVTTHQATPATAEFIEPAPASSTDASLAFPVAGAEPERIAFVEAARPVGPEQVVSFGPPSPAAIAPGVGAAPVAAADPLASETPSGGDLGDASPAVHAFPATPAFAVSNACFVTRVRAWGAVDRFPEAAFRPGQDVIVYFEIDAPTARQSTAGHTTSIDTLFRLVAADGRQIGQWDFEPIEETCHAPRRDYFARYFLRIPETAPPGACRLEFVVTDLVTGASTQAHLDLDVR